MIFLFMYFYAINQSNIKLSLMENHFVTISDGKTIFRKDSSLEVYSQLMSFFIFYVIRLYVGFSCNSSVGNVLLDFIFFILSLIIENLVSFSQKKIAKIKN